MPRLRQSSLIIFLTLLLSACQFPQVGVNLPESPSGSVLFQDDFSDPSSGWDRQDGGKKGLLDYAGGAYRIAVNQPDLMLWGSPGLRFTDVRIEVNITKTAGGQDDQFGIICRAKDENNFYFLAISSDGYYGIGKVVDGAQSLIGLEAMPPSEMIVQGKALNHLRADCIGENLSLYANSVLLQSARDADFTAGDVGLFAGTLASPGTDILFDSFSVLKP